MILKKQKATMQQRAGVAAMMSKQLRVEQSKKEPMMVKKIAVGLAALGAVSLGVYLRFIRPWQLRWGATDEEVGRAMHGDDVVKYPTCNATRAVTIKARPEEIWPWLVQMGITRAGWYSYDWLDNLGTPSAERIVPELQHVAVGDMIPMSPDGKQGLLVKVGPQRRFHLVLGTLSAR
jgi:hypothetical protein